MKGTWDEQHLSRLKGFLLDTLGSDVESSTVGMFVQLSFQEKLVSLVQSNDNLGLQQHCQQLGKRYNSALVAECCQVWHHVFGQKGRAVAKPLQAQRTSADRDIDIKSSLTVTDPELEVPRTYAEEAH